MYRLPQAGILEKNLLAQFLHSHGYYQVKCTPVLCIHVWITIKFELLVDNFGFGYVGQEHADHLMNALKMYYENIITKWEGKLYCGIKIKWDYTKRYVEIITVTGPTFWE